MDLPAAATWLRKAAEQGNNEAQNRYAVMLDESKGVPRDDTTAVVWYRKAALQGNQDAQNNLGMMYEHGEGSARSRGAGSQSGTAAGDRQLPGGHDPWDPVGRDALRGQTVLVGRLAGLKRPSSLSMVCFDYHYRCQGSNFSSSGHTYNMAGLGPNCTSDTVDIDPACPADQVMAEVTSFVVCR